MQADQRWRSAAIELGALLLPAIPALVWLWPALRGSALIDLAQVVAYLYFLLGSLAIGLRRWRPEALGLSGSGFVFSLVAGAMLIVERVLAQIAFGFPLRFQPFAAERVLQEIGFYFVLVGGVEELLFRGLVFRILHDWRGPGVALIGSSLAFALWHIGWAGSLMAAHFVIGLVFALIRWRAGGIAGLILVHGLFDLVAVEMPFPVALSGIEQVLTLTVRQPWALVAGDGLLIGLVWLLWRAPGKRLGGHG